MSKTNPAATLFRSAPCAEILVLVIILGMRYGLAHAVDPDPFKFFVGHSVAHDDNLFRLSDGDTLEAQIGTPERSDIVRSTVAGFAFDRLYSRQRISAAAALTRNRFDRFSFLDHDASSANGSWQWEMGRHWNGMAVAERAKKLTDFVDFREPVKNINTYQRSFLDGYYRFHPDWSVGIGGGKIRSTNSAAVRRTSDYTVKVFEVGMRYSPRSGNEVAATIRRSAGDYPTRQVVAASTIDNSFDQTSAEVTGAWQITGASRLGGVVGYTFRQHDEVRQRDFRGIIGRATYNWKIDGKTSVNLTARREIDAQEDVNQNYILTNGISVSPTWMATAKLTFDGKLDYRRRDYKGEPGFFVTGLPQRKDRIRTASAGATYQPVQALELGLTYQFERRTSNTPGIPYRDRLVAASVQFAF